MKLSIRGSKSEHCFFHFVAIFHLCNAFTVAKFEHRSNKVRGQTVTSANDAMDAKIARVCHVCLSVHPHTVEVLTRF